MTNEENKIYTAVVSKCQDYQIFMRKNYEVTVDYFMTFDDKTGMFTLHWASFDEEWRRRKRKDGLVSGSMTLINEEQAEEWLELMCVEAVMSWSNLHKVTTDHSHAKRALRMCMERKNYWEGYFM